MRTLARHRAPAALGAIFVTVGVVYWLVQSFLGAPRVDMTGVVALVLLGFAMTFTFAVLLSGNETDQGGQ
jgi:predicted branched-subunit amino acid permease